MTEREAVKLIRKQLKWHRMQKIDETPDVFVFLCENPVREIMPNKMAVAVGKKTGKTAASITSVEDIINAVM